VTRFARICVFLDGAALPGTSSNYTILHSSREIAVKGAALHGVVMLADQGLLTGQVAHITREELVEDMVAQTKMALSVAIKAADDARA
jgi:hypothetical protein